MDKYRTENKKRQKIKRKRTALWKRCIAAAAAVVTVLTSLSYDGLENVFAEEKSGYQIDVSYSEDKASAVLTGNAGNVPAGTTLTAITGTDGAEYDPNSFQMTVTENGTYTYTLAYSVSAAETGQTVEKKETLKVTVDQIQVPQVSTMSETSAEQPVASDQITSRDSTGGTAQSLEQADEASQNSEEATTSADAPETVPLAELEAELETLADEAKSERPTWPVYQYAAEERRLSLVKDPVEYKGGMFADNAPGYTESGVKRSFAEASLMVMAGDSGSGAGVTITGLYPKVLESDGSQDVEWYYTTADSATSDQGYGPVQVGYLLPDNTQVRLYYKAPDNPTYDIVFKTNSMSVTASEYNLTVKNTSLKAVNDKVSAAPTERVMVEFKKPSAVENMTVEIRSGLGKTLASFNTSDPSGSGLTDEGEGNYSGMFIMDSAAASITISGTIYGTANRWFTAFSSIDADPSMLSANYPKSLGMSRTYTMEIDGKSVNEPRYKDDGSGDVYYDYWGGTSLGGWRVPGYGLKNYVSGGVPYTHTYRISGQKSSDNYTFAPYETLRRGDSNSGTSNGNGTVDVKVSQASDSRTFTAPVSRFAVGSKVKVRFETAIRNTDAQSWSVAPNALSVDVYTDQGQFSTTNFTRESFILPKKGSVTYNLETGGKVTIECKTYNGSNVYNNLNESPVSHPRRFQDGYMFSTSFYNNSNKLFDFQGSPNSFPGVVDMRWYAYEITVEGVYHDFKLYQTITSGAHRNAIVNLLDNDTEAAVILDPDRDNAGGADTSPYESDMNGRSYVYLRMSEATNPGYQALELPFVFRSFMKPSNGNIKLALAIRRGYSPPSVTSDNSNVTVSANGYSNGAYQYTINMSGSDGNAAPSNINVSSKPVEFRAQFYEKGVGKVQGTDIVTLGYGDSQSRNYVIIPPEAVLTKFPKLTNFEAYLVKTDGTTTNNGEIKLKTLNGSTVWHTGDIISYDAIYDQAVEQKFLVQGRDFYRLEIRAVEDNTGAAMIEGKYQIMQQESFSSGDSYAEEAFAKVVEASVQALKTSEVVIVGYRDAIIDEKGSNHFKLGTKSQTSGKLNNSGDVVGQLYYLAAVRARIDASGVKELTDQTEALNRIQAWNETNADELYTGVSGESNIVDYADLYTYLSTNFDNFRGFQIKNVQTDQVYDDYTLTDQNGADLYLIGAGGDGYTASTTIWNALFADSGGSRGQLVLVPTFGAPEKKIVSTSGTLITTGDNVDTYSMGNRDPYGGSGSFSITGNFKYTGERRDSQLASVRWAVTRIKADATADTAELLAYGTLAMNTDTVTADPNVQYGWASEAEGERVLVGKSGFIDDTTEFQLLFNISHDSTNPITYNEQQDAKYTIHAWIEDVGDTDNLTSKGNTNYPSQSKLGEFPIAAANADVYKTFWNGETAASDDTDVPGYTHALKILPQFVASDADPQNGDSTQHLTENKTVGERQNFELTADFTYDELYPAELQGISGSASTDNAKIHTALFRKGATDAWTLWAWDNNLTAAAGSGNTAKVTVKSITAGSEPDRQDEITVGYTINNVSNSITKDQEEGAQYCIVAWNATNNGFTVNETSVNQNLNPGNGTAYEDVPSVTTTIAVEQNKITPDGTDMVQTGAGVTTYTGGTSDPSKYDGSFPVEGTFNYTGDSMLADGKLWFAVTKYETHWSIDDTGNISSNDGDHTKLYKMMAYGTITKTADGTFEVGNSGGQYLGTKLEFVGVDDTTNEGKLTLKFRIKETGNEANPAISYEWEHDSIYTVHAWSEGNTNTPTSEQLRDWATTNTGTAPARSEEMRKQFFELETGTLDIPGVSHTIKVLPKRVGNAEQDLHFTAEELGIKAEKNFDLNVAFKYDKNYPKSLQNGTNTSVPEAQIHTAIFKRNPEGSQNRDWVLWMWDENIETSGKTDTSEDKVGRQDLNLTNGTLAVTYNLINAKNSKGGSTITWEWEDGAEYYIVAWNGSNASFTVNKSNIESNLKPGITSEANNVTPSVLTPIAVQWQDATYYVKVPARVILTDNGDVFTDGKKPDYAGESAEVTYAAFTDTEAPEIEVKVSDSQKMTVTGSSSGTSNELTMLIYSADGVRREPTAGYSWLGILSTKKSTVTSGNIESQNSTESNRVYIPDGLPRGTSLPFQINAETSSASREEMYHGTLTYDFTLRDWNNPS